MDRLDELEVLMAVVDGGSLAAAARRLHRSPAAVTRALAALEERAGVRLIERSTRASAPSQAGAALAARGRALLAAYDEALDRAMDPERPRGRLRVTAPEVFGRMHVAPLVTELLERHPALTAELSMSDALVDLVAEGIDVAVRVGSLADSSLSATRVGAVREQLAASPAYLEAHGAPLTPSELGRHSVLWFSSHTGIPEWRFRGDQVVRLSPRLVVDRAEVAIAAARDGRGVVRALSYQLVTDLEAGRLVRLLGAHEPPPIPVHLVHPSRRLVPPRVRAFLDLAAPRLRALPALRAHPPLEPAPPLPRNHR
ncbi:MAG: LysR family transcriptional regulator [Sandaracinaceae bacterium]